MKVKTLIEELSKLDKELEVKIYGCYASEGDIEEIQECIDKRNGVVCVIFSDICSG